MPDRGVEVGNRVLRLDDPLKAHIPKHFVRRGVKQVLLLALRKCDIGGISSLDQVGRSDAVASGTESLFQLFVHTLSKMREHYFHENPKAMTGAKYPIEVYLEVAVESETTARERREAEGMCDINGRPYPGFRQRALMEMYGVSSEDVKSYSGGGTAAHDGQGPPLTEFMKGFDDRNVVEYRYWIMISETELDFTQHFYELLSYAEKQRNQRLMPKTLAADARQTGHRHGSGIGAGGSVRGSASRMSSVVTDLERWAVVATPEQYVNLCAIYLRDASLARPDNMARCMSVAKSLTHPDNPVNPAHVFAPHMYFGADHSKIDAAQLQPSNYFRLGQNNEVEWYFPFETCVVSIPSDKHHIAALRQLYFPDYQARVIQPRLSRRYYPYELAAIRATRVRQAEAVERARRASAQRAREDARAHGDGGGGRSPQNSMHHDMESAELSVDSDVGDDDELSHERVPRPETEQTTLAQMRTRSGVSQRGWSNDGITNRTNFDDALDDIDRQQLASQDYGDVETRERAAAVSEALTGSDSALSTLASHYAYFQAKRRMALVDDKERAVQYTRDQEAAFNDYLHNCAQPESRISLITAKMNQWFAGLVDAGEASFRNAPQNTFAPKLSTFALMTIETFSIVEDLYGMFAAHREFFHMRTALFDTYRHEYVLHYNVLVNGPPSVGKSWILKLLKHIAIKDTVLLFSRPTANADNIAVDRDDECVGYEEIPRDMICENEGMGGGNNATLDKIKEKLASCRVNTRAFSWKGENGTQAGNADRSSSQIGGLIALTNVQVHLMAMAIRSRMSLLSMADSTRDDKQRSTINQSLKTKPGVAARAEHEKIQVFRLTQFLVMHVFKLIYTGALHHVSTPVFGLYIAKFIDVLTNEFAMAIDPRHIMRMEMMVRVLVIEEAIVRLYRQKTSPYYGKNVEIEHLKYIDSWLKDHQELVLWVFSFMMELIVQPNTTAVVNALATHAQKHATTLAAFRSRASFEQQQFSRRSYGAQRRAEHLRTFQASQQQFPPRQSDTIAPGLPHIIGVAAAESTTTTTTTTTTLVVAEDAPDMLSPPPPPAQVNATAEQQPVPPVPKKVGLGLVAAADAHAYDWNYMRIAMRPEQLTRHLSIALKKRGERQLDVRQVAAELDTLTTRNIRSHPFKQNLHFGEKGHVDCDQPVVLDHTGAVDMLQAVILNHSAVYVHSSLLFRPVNDPFEAVKKRCIDAFTPHATYLSGKQYDSKTPHIFQTYEVAPCLSTKTMYHNQSSLNNVAARIIGFSLKDDAATATTTTTTAAGDVAPVIDNANVQAWMSAETCVLAQSVDEYATVVHMDRICLKAHPELIDDHTPRLVDALLRHPDFPELHDDNWETAKTIDYPNDPLETIKHAAEFTRLSKLANSVRIAELEELDEFRGHICKETSDAEHERVAAKLALIDPRRAKKQLLRLAERKKVRDCRQALENEIMGAQQPRLEAEQRKRQHALVEASRKRARANEQLRTQAMFSVGESVPLDLHVDADDGDGDDGDSLDSLDLLDLDGTQTTEERGRERAANEAAERESVLTEYGSDNCTLIL